MAFSLTLTFNSDEVDDENVKFLIEYLFPILRLLLNIS